MTHLFLEFSVFVFSDLLSALSDNTTHSMGPLKDIFFLYNFINRDVNMNFTQPGNGQAKC